MTLLEAVWFFLPAVVAVCVFLVFWGLSFLNLIWSIIDSSEWVDNQLAEKISYVNSEGVMGMITFATLATVFLSIAVAPLSLTVPFLWVCGFAGVVALLRLLRSYQKVVNAHMENKEIHQ